MPLNRRSSKYPYAGRVYDGPCEGDYIEDESPHYLATFTVPILQIVLTSPDTAAERSAFAMDRCLYRWSRDIRAWVWVQS